MATTSPTISPIENEYLILEYRPHIERGGYHLDRFGVFLKGEQIIRSTRSPLYDGARALLEHGHDPEQLITIRLAGRAKDGRKARDLTRASRHTARIPLRRDAGRHRCCDMRKRSLASGSGRARVPGHVEQKMLELVRCLLEKTL